MQQALSFMRRWQMLPEKGALLLCAVSGGRDSVCLLHFLAALAKEEDFRLAAAHFDHRLRGAESEEDAAFVQALCARWGIPCVAGSGDVRTAAEENGWSLEEAARNCRYAFLARVAEQLGAEKIATAHQAEDNAETLLLHLARGAGGEGLGGIPPVRGRFVRPFLTTTRAEIEAYTAANRLPFREDSSNGDIRYARNLVRREVLPVLRTLNPRLSETLAQSIAVFREENALLDALARAELGEIGAADGRVFAPKERFLRTEPCLRPRMLRLLIDALGVGKKDFTARHLAALERLALEGGEGDGADLPLGVRGRCERGLLVLERRGTIPRDVELGEEMSVSWGKYTITRGKIGQNIPKSPDTILLKYDMIDAAVTVGAWNSAQRLTLPGARGTRSLKRLFADAGLSPEEREETPVICVGGRAAAVYGVGTDAAFLPGRGEAALPLTIKKNVRTD